MKKTALGASALVLALATAACVEETPSGPVESTTTTEAPVTTTTEPVDDREGRFVATTGSDSGLCDAPEAPCATINYAVDKALAGETVYVEAGTYPELVSVTKSLTFSGPNAGISASSGAERGAEAIVKGFRNAGTPHPTAATATNAVIDGFTTNPQGDSALLTPNSFNAISLFGGTDVQIINNIIQGADTYVADCGATCTDMMDGAVLVQSGTAVISDNLVENFRRPLDITTSAQAPVVDIEISNNLVRQFSFRAFWALQNGSVFDEGSVTVSDNVFLGTVASAPTGALVSGGGITFENNEFINVSAGIYEPVCGPQNADVVPNNYIGNTFNHIITAIHIQAVADCGERVVAPVITGNSFDPTIWPGRSVAPHGVGTSGVGVPAPSIAAPCNFFGSDAGPGVDGNARVTATVNAAPWATAPGVCAG